MISFVFNISDSILDFNQKQTAGWIESAIKNEGKIPGDISYTFCGDKGLLEINKTFLNHDTYTDIISFPTSGNPDIVSGEIFISIDRVRENAIEFGAGTKKELYRVMIHGILHFLGFEDHSSADKKQMRAKEDYYLHLHPEFH